MFEKARSWLACALAVVFALAAPLAQAHAIHVFARGDGRRLTGYAYFTLSSRAHGAEARLLGKGDQLLATTTTNDNGEFSFDLTRRGAYAIVVKTADGHEGRYEIKAAELDPSLPAAEAGAATATPSSTPAPPADVTGGNEAEKNLASHDSALLNEMLARQREQLEGFENRSRARDIVGAIGYILGLTGVAFYFLGDKRRKDSKDIKDIKDNNDSKKTEDP